MAHATTERQTWFFCDVSGSDTGTAALGARRIAETPLADVAIKDAHRAPHRAQ